MRYVIRCDSGHALGGIFKTKERAISLATEWANIKGKTYRVFELAETPVVTVIPQLNGGSNG